jgi:hypothetical protein
MMVSLGFHPNLISGFREYYFVTRGAAGIKSGILAMRANYSLTSFYNSYYLKSSSICYYSGVFLTIFSYLLDGFSDDVEDEVQKIPVLLAESLREEIFSSKDSFYDLLDGILSWSKKLLIIFSFKLWIFCVKFNI